MKNSLCLVLAALVYGSMPLNAQITSFPYSESFDGTTAPSMPPDWSINGFIVNTATFRSSPNCVSTTGNSISKSIISPIFNFADRIPEKLVFWERRSNTATAYRFEVRASIDGTDFNILLARYDTISSTSGYVQRIVYLEGSGLQLQSNVRFQWQLLGDNTNTTGVLRIDDVSLTVLAGLDIGFISMAVSPSNASRRDTFNISVGVKNYGLSAASGFSIHFFVDDNFNGSAELGEQFSVVRGFVLNPNDSLFCVASYLPPKAGEFYLIAALEYSQDGNKTNDTIHTNINVRCLRGDLLINEIMYAPTGDEPEWIELWNNSPDTVNLKNWKISDNNVSTKSVISQVDMFVAPNSFLVVAKDVNFATIHPGISFTLANFSPLNNTTPDAVVLYDPFFCSIDSVMYQLNWGGQGGKSLERIDLDTLSTRASNWGSSQELSGSTPGQINSIARMNYDIALNNLIQIQSASGGKNQPAIQMTIQNLGRRTIDSIIVRFFVDTNHNMMPDISELVQSTLLDQELIAGDSVQISESFAQLNSGERNFIVVAENWRDERLRNNRASISLKVGCRPRSLIINEIMYDPLDGQNEWIELYNRTTQPIDLAEWTFNDRATLSGVNTFVISDSAMIVQPSGFVVVAAESTICNLYPNLKSVHPGVCLSILNHPGGFSLNNDGDVIVLKDLTGQVIDSVAYLPRWHHPDIVDTHGRSLEHINPDIDSNDPRNWSTCTNILGGTPGAANSILAATAKNGATISLSPNPFSPDGDGYEDFCLIHLHLTFMTSTIHIRLYDIKGRLVRTLIDGQISGSTNDFVWDGRDDQNQRVRVGVYVVFLEATDQISGKAEVAKAVAVVAARF
jgi:hypothetical protein